MLVFKGVKKELGSFELGPIDFEMESGMVLGLFGANGSGKTSLIKLISGEDDIDDGTISFNGNFEYRNDLGYIPAYFPFENFSSLKEVQRFYRSIYPNFDKLILNELLDQFDLSLNLKPKSLSLGMRQKFMLALVLSLGVQLIVMDEPTEGLDFFTKHEIFVVLRDYLYETNATVVIATHELESYESIVDYAMYLEKGEVLLASDMTRFIEKGSQYVKGAVDLKSFAYLRQKEQVDD